MKRLFNLTSQTKIDAKKLGFTKELTSHSGRLINKNGSFNIRKKSEFSDTYHDLISMSWFKFLLLVLVSFTIINGVFAIAYLALGVENIYGLTKQNLILDLINCFHFSVQTMTTVGYGYIHPISIPVHVVSSFNAMMGLLSYAMAAGLVYGRFSFPRANIKYSNNALMVKNDNGTYSLQVRLANLLNHDLLDANARMILIHNEKVENHIEKRFSELELVVSKIDFLLLTWTVIHKIDEKSPLYNVDETKMNLSNSEVIVLITAYDDTFSQTVYSRTSYLCTEIIWDAKWDSPYKMIQGEKTLDIKKIDNYTKNQIE